jgi:hypothetical protein
MIGEVHSICVREQCDGRCRRPAVTRPAISHAVAVVVTPARVGRAIFLLPRVARRLRGKSQEIIKDLFKRI